MDQAESMIPVHRNKTPVIALSQDLCSSWQVHTRNCLEKFPPFQGLVLHLCDKYATGQRGSLDKSRARMV